MASGAYQAGIKKILDGTIDLDTTTLKIMLVDNGYTYNPDHDFVDDISSTEITATNYTAGYGGSGRKTATVALSVDNTNNKVIGTITDLTWTALGGATNDTVDGAVLLYETGGSDATAIPLFFFDFTGVTTNGGDFTLDFASSGSGGNIQFAC